MNSSPDFSRRIPQLDGLRGVAIAMVVIYHYAGNVVALGPSRFVNEVLIPTNIGWSGVDLFFVLSGFLIGGILLDARGSPNYFRIFYTRRACRIFPIYFVFLALVYLLTHFSGSLQSVLQPAIPWQASVIFGQNFWMAIRNLMGARAANPTWSLSVEEQFYLLIPAVIYFARSRYLVWILGMGIILAPLVRLGIFLANPHLITAMYVLLPCRMDSLLLGVLTAYFLREPGAWEFARSHRKELWTAIELLTAACGLFVIRSLLSARLSTFDPLMMILGYDCLGLLYACILVASLVDRGLARVLQVKWLMGLGSLAYCVYLIHELVFAAVLFVLKGRPHTGLITSVVAVLLTIVIAKLSWKWFEEPFIKLGHRESYQPLKSIASRATHSAGYIVATRQ